MLAYLDGNQESSRNVVLGDALGAMTTRAHEGHSGLYVFIRGLSLKRYR